MTSGVLATIRWLTPDEGGRLRPPTGPRYCTVADFCGHPPGQPAEAWSVVLDFVGPTENGQGLATVNFLFPERAPARLLNPGATFALMEGPRVVARCIVRGNERLQP